MLRPATPLTILLLISFILLLLSVISTPIVHSIPIATFEGVNFGVLGYCKGSTCSGIRVGYTTDGLFGNSANDGDFNLPSNARHSLSSLLIVHVVAAFMNLIALALAAAAHLHSPSHSARYLLGLLILLLPTLLVTLLAFLVDILLFVPHLQWGGWIVLGSTILITASGVVTCAMRRTLVSRKARKKRIAENAEMSGENFYTRQAQESAKSPPPAPTPFATESKAPMVNGAPGADALPSFATFNSGRRSDEERAPLNRLGTSSNVSPVASRDDGTGRYYGPPSRSNSRPPVTSGVDQYGNPLPPEVVGAMTGPSPRRSLEERRGPGPYRDTNVPPQRGGGLGPRGRGGYPPRGGRGGYGPGPGPGYGAPPGPPPQGYSGRGGYPGEARGGYPGRGRGGFPTEPMAAGAGTGMVAAGMMNRNRGPAPPGYPPQDSDISSDQYTPPNEMPDRRPPPLQDPGMQPYGNNGGPRYEPSSPSNYATSPNEHFVPYAADRPPSSKGRASPYGSRHQSPASGMRRASPPPAMPPMMGGPPPNMAAFRAPVDGSGQNEYVPPRAAWAGGHHAATVSNDNFRQGPPNQPYRGASGSRPHRRMDSGGSDIYYEDVDPRFAAESEPPPPMPVQGVDMHPTQPLPRILAPGSNPHLHNESPDSVNHALGGSNSYEDLPGARSPAESETSNFTSVSQRGVNPNWKPGHGGEFSNLGPARRPPQSQMRREVLLAGNPDFEIPGMTGTGRPGRGRGGMRGAMMGGPVRPPPPPSAVAAMGGDGRYPLGPPPGPGGMREI